MKKIYCWIFISFFLTSCRVDFSNPKSVLEKYISFYNTGKLKAAYELLADTCKDYAALQDYLDYYSHFLDSNLEQNKYLLQNINQLPLNAKYLKYRRFEVEKKEINKKNNDTLKHFYYYTVFNEKGKWKVLWTDNLGQAAKNLYNTQEFESSINTFLDLLKYDPLNGLAYQNIGWCYYRRNDLQSALYFAKKAIELSPKDCWNYNLIAGIYRSQNNFELAIEEFIKAVNLTSTNDEKSYTLCNLSLVYVDLNKYDKAKESINKASSINPKHTHAWYVKGVIYNKENNLDSAICCFKKAISLEPMNDFIQKDLYFSLAHTLYSKALHYSYDNSERKILLSDSKRYILKALAFEYNNGKFQQLFKDINRINH